ncbi:MFS transporter, NNP family, nitrate/nitrite transporter [Amycolatopsis arida]|uniref:MFS transporter, NNP family, nitrate/nitrite transporter n=1 Tax=Amycolatopsis arida TaxID=587909 RepID=A0A1I5WDM8_9PSEU|nr:nitrate/nitrite transporter [Amycolatopsis arida]TDX92229.1 NNP family nitrate/nitrite transporter-like MFS transporter [Amycolatopsis arida]SFQ17785.1 MFS transporter, NNP family, nitrate/nitrite transporter [Amycolatopsis arida]
MTVVAEQPTDRPSKVRKGRWIDHWEPERPEFWAGGGRRIAWRNLGFSVLAEHLGFNVWILMSIVVVSLGDVGISFGVGQTFWLLILPNLVGAALRVPYTFAIPRFGGRAWTTTSASLLLIPCAMLLIAVTTQAPYWFFLLTAAAMGFGGGNFSSSMANISFFFPEGKKGLALGLNAAGGNLGVAVTQLFVPIVISTSTGVNLAYAALMWMPVIVLSAACSWLFMDSLTQAKPDGTSYRLAMRNKHTWVMSLLYIGTFGSFIGFSFAFPSLIKISFVGFQSFVGLAFLGALIGSVSRPFGGWLADRVGGARITLLNFLGMAAGTVGVLVSVARHDFALFFGSFVLLFVLTGIGNGSTYRMIPMIFAAEGRRMAAEPGADAETAMASAKRQAAAVVGVAGAVGAFGGVLVNLVFKFSLEGTDRSLTSALVAILAFYAVCVVTTWWFYLRRSFAVKRAPSLAHAGV